MLAPVSNNQTLFLSHIKINYIQDNLFRNSVLKEISSLLFYLSISLISINSCVFASHYFISRIIFHEDSSHLSYYWKKYSIVRPIQH